LKGKDSVKRGEPNGEDKGTRQYYRDKWTRSKGIVTGVNFEKSSKWKKRISDNEKGKKKKG